MRVLILRSYCVPFPRTITTHFLFFIWSFKNSNVRRSSLLSVGGLRPFYACQRQCQERGGRRVQLKPLLRNAPTGMSGRSAD